MPPRAAVFAACAAGAALALLCACGAGATMAPTVQTVTGRTQGTTYRVSYVGPGDVGDIRTNVEAEFATFDRAYSHWRDDATIARFNAHRSTEPFDVGAAFVAVVRDALDIATRTDGAFDPTVFPLVSALGFGPTPVRDPDPAGIAAARALVGHQKLRVVDDRHLAKSDPRMTIDLNAFVPGVTVDRVVARLGELGCVAAMVEIGGEVRCFGVKPDGQPWRIGIEAPDGAGAPGPTVVQEIVALRDAALATSGNYRRFAESGGARRHHVLDPRTGANAENDVVSVTVTASTCALADALATTLMVVGPDGAEAVLARFDDAKLGAMFLLRADAAADVVVRRFRWSVGPD
jgi:thiamine biosynthesis lipoprotein